MYAEEGVGQEAESRRAYSASAFIHKTDLGSGERCLRASGDALLGLSQTLAHQGTIPL